MTDHASQSEEDVEIQAQNRYAYERGRKRAFAEVRQLLTQAGMVPDAVVHDAVALPPRQKAIATLLAIYELTEPT